MAAQLPASSRHTNNRGSSIPSGWAGASCSALKLTSGSNRGRSRSCSEAGRRDTECCSRRSAAHPGSGRSPQPRRPPPDPIDVEQRLGGAVDRAHGVVGPAGAGRPGVQGPVGCRSPSAPWRRRRHPGRPPSGRHRHAAPGAGSGEQQDRQELGLEQLPVVGVVSLRWATAMPPGRPGRAEPDGLPGQQCRRPRRQEPVIDSPAGCAQGHRRIAGGSATTAPSSHPQPSSAIQFGARWWC
jgi:hypothetical protein